MNLMNIQKNAKTSFAIAAILLLVTLGGLLATKALEIDQPADLPKPAKTYSN